MTKEQISGFLKTALPYFLIAAVVVTAAGFGWSRYQSHNHPAEHTAHTTYPENFLVTSVEFGGFGTQTLPPGHSIIMHFTQPVNGQGLANYFELTPSVTGEFVQDLNRTTVQFVPTYPLVTGVNYVVKIKAGLNSELGKTLVEDFTKVIALGFTAEDFKIVKNNRFALFQSVALNNPEVLRTQIGSLVEKPSLKIYQANDPEDIIRDALSQSRGAYGNTNPQVPQPTFSTTLISSLDNIEHGTPVPLPKQVGLYLIETYKNNEKHGHVWVSLNTIGAHFRQDDQKYILAAQDLNTGEPLSNLELTSYTVNDEAATFKQSLRRSFSGISSIPLEHPDKVDIIFVRKGAEIAVVPVNIRGSLAELNVYQNFSESYQGFIYTERPIYKPTDTVKFRAIVRQDNDGLYQIPASGTKIKLTVRDENYNEIVRYTQEVSLNDHGILNSELNLNNLPAKKYFIEMAMVGSNPWSLSSVPAWFEVLDYKKPDFELSADVDKEEYTEGDQLHITLKGNRFDGKDFGRQTVKYTLYTFDYYETEKAVYNEAFNLTGWGGMCGGGFSSPFETYYGEPIEPAKEITLNANGEATVLFDTKKLTQDISQQLTVVVEKQDSKGNTVLDAQTAVVHNGEINIFVRPLGRTVTADRTPQVIFSAETQSGQKLTNHTFNYTVESVRYDYNPTTGSTRIPTTLKAGKITTNAQGIGQFAVEGLDQLGPSGETIEVSVQTKDNRGNTITGRQSFYRYTDVSQVTSPLLLDINAQNSNLIVGSTASMTISAPAAMKVLLAFERGRVYDAAWLNLKKGNNTFTFTVKPEYAPTITPTFTAFYNNHYYSEGLTFNVPAMNKLLDVAITTDKQNYQAGEVAKITITTANNQTKKPVAASVSVGIIDKAIFSLRKSTQMPLHSSFYFFRSRRTSNSSSMTGIGFGDAAEQGGGGGESGNLAGKDTDVLYWNGELETDANGKLEIFVPVTGTTVWKGVVYATSQDSALGQTDFEFSSR